MFQQDPCIISNWTDYEPYEKFKQADANVKWPAEANPPYGSVDDDLSILGYVRIIYICKDKY